MPTAQAHSGEGAGDDHSTHRSVETVAQSDNDGDQSQCADNGDVGDLRRPAAVEPVVKPGNE